MKAKDKLIELHACKDAVKWVGDMTLQEAWDNCERGDWMLWLYAKMYPDNIRELTLAKGHCANTVRHLMLDERSLKAVDTAIAFGEGRATLDELTSAAVAAYAADDDAVDDDAAFAAAVAADASDASYAVFAAAVVAADAAASSACAAAAYAADYVVDAKKENRKQTADICRKYLKVDLRS